MTASAGAGGRVGARGKEDNPFSFATYKDTAAAVGTAATTPFPEVGATTAATAAGGGGGGGGAPKKKKAAASLAAAGAAAGTAALPDGPNPFSFKHYLAAEVPPSGGLPLPPKGKPVGARRDSDDDLSLSDDDDDAPFARPARPQQQPPQQQQPPPPPAAAKVPKAKRAPAAPVDGPPPPPPPPLSGERSGSLRNVRSHEVPFPEQDDDDGFGNDDDDDDDDDDDGFSDDDQSRARDPGRPRQGGRRTGQTSRPVVASTSGSWSAGSSGVDGAAVDALQRKLDKERALRQAVEARLQETERSYLDLRKKDAEETKTLEQAMRTVEQALATANQRALTAETQAAKLQKDITLLYAQLADARRQAQLAQMQAQAASAAAAAATAGQMPGVGPPLGSDPAIYADVQSAIHALDKVVKEARDGIRVLVNGASQVEAISLLLQNLGRMTEPGS